MRNLSIYPALLHFLIRYRRTALGPLWLLVGPALFIALLGLLYAHIGSITPSEFIPHLAIGFITWTLISGFITNSATVYQRGRAQIMQGGMTLDDIVMTDVITTALNFLHQVFIVIAVFLIYNVSVTLYALTSLIGLVLIIANGVWVTRLFGILGARYRDLSEVFQAVMRIAFLATPIIWMPGQGMQDGIIEHFLALNPFHHFLEVVRAPLLGKPVEPLSWAVVLCATLIGTLLTRLFAARFSRYVPLWV
jgi:ABC-type polysaccharide/polyol phosphate export permease